MESLCDIDRNIIDTILHGALAQGGEHLRHLLTVGIGHLVGLQLELLAALKVDKEMGACIVVEIHLVGKVVSVEDNDLVFVVAQVTQGIEERLLHIGTHESIGEEDDKRALVELLGGEVKRFWY